MAESWGPKLCQCCQTGQGMFCCGACACPCVGFGVLMTDWGMTQSCAGPAATQLCLAAGAATAATAISGPCTATAVGTGLHLLATAQRAMFRYTLGKKRQIVGETMVMACCMELFCYGCSMAQLRGDRLSESKPRRVDGRDGLSHFFGYVCANDNLLSQLPSNENSMQR